MMAIVGSGILISLIISTLIVGHRWYREYRKKYEEEKRTAREFIASINDIEDIWVSGRSIGRKNVRKKIDELYDER